MPVTSLARTMRAHVQESVMPTLIPPYHVNDPLAEFGPDLSQPDDGCAEYGPILNAPVARHHAKVSGQPRAGSQGAKVLTLLVEGTHTMDALAGRMGVRPNGRAYDAAYIRAWSHQLARDYGFKILVNAAGQISATR